MRIDKINRYIKAVAVFCREHNSMELPHHFLWSLTLFPEKEREGRLRLQGYDVENLCKLALRCKKIAISMTDKEIKVCHEFFFHRNVYNGNINNYKVIRCCNLFKGISKKF